ncbi:exopolysaccharide production protein ExoY [Bradyrhizobium sp. AZCC 1610]|uniref:sugar transferase n=1 Tax=Bradyrhizobium sp. AZCC 1610 TaxID=3117020 RepID=UPI002FF2C2EF
MQLFPLPKSATTDVKLLIDKSITQKTARYPVGGFPKRILDVVISSTALLVFAPLFCFIALLLKIADRGPVFFQQTRVGFRSSRFACLKFRTMVTDGNAVLAQHLRDFPDAATEWAETRKLKRDPRVTELGRVLRQLSLDELPQLWNVLRGDMSIVGPRPIVFDEVKMYGPSAEHYLLARPGLTGAWQISGRNDVSYERRVSLDRDYIENWSFWKDLKIIVKTIPAVIAAKGTY